MEPGEEDQARLEGRKAMTAETAKGIDEANSGTTAVREGYAFDEARLAEWMRASVPDFAGPFRVEQFRGGQSNPTYKLITPGRAYVLRRKPPGNLVPGAHAVEREARVLQRLGEAGFPVARVYGLCTDEAVIGTWFYVMEHVEGRIFWDATFPGVPREDRPRYFFAMSETLAQLHAIDPEAAGLGDYGKPGNYFARQIGRWTRQYLGDEAAGRNADMEALIDWLPAHIPPGDETCVIHGDFRCDNMFFDPAGPRIRAVLDWELSTLGHPLADFAYSAMMYRMPPRIVAGLDGADLAALNIPSEEQYIASYCKAAGRSDIPHYEFYIAFNLFRLAAIFHGIKGRVIRGTAANAHAAERAKSFPILARMARDSARRCREGL